MGRKRSSRADLDAVEALLDRQRQGARFSAWELDFLDSVHDQLTGGGSLTPAQGEKLDEMWNVIISKRLR